MKANAVFIAVATLTVSSLTSAHVRLKSPTPRSASDGVKTGPCGGLARSATPTAVTGGQLLTVTWEETINHPGRFLISFSSANDQFAGNILKTVIDEQNAETALPHQYSTQVRIPDVDCETCSVQLIQSMEENPAAPTYYYSCADLKITKSTSTSSPGPVAGNNQNSVNQSSEKVNSTFGSGCGTIGPRGGPGGPMAGLLILLPFFLWFRFAIQTKKRGHFFK